MPFRLSDMTCRDPAELFKEPLYRESGTLFFHDFQQALRERVSDVLWSFLEEYVRLAHLSDAALRGSAMVRLT